MFNEINGLPVHPLVIHAAVVLVPLSALLGVLFVIPRTRAWARIPLLLVSLGAAASVYVSRESGEALRENLNLEDNSELPAASLIDVHEDRAYVLFIATLIFAAIAVAAFVLSRSATSYSGPLAAVVSVLLILGALGVAYQTYRVGEIGSKAVWNPTGDQDFSSTSD